MCAKPRCGTKAEAHGTITTTTVVQTTITTVMRHKSGYCGLWGGGGGIGGVFRSNFL